MSLLAGFRVVQIGDGLAAAVCGRLLADIGADVSCFGADGSSYLAEYLNYGKRIVDDRTTRCGLSRSIRAVLVTKLGVGESAHDHRRVPAVLSYLRSAPLPHDQVVVGEKDLDRPQQRPRGPCSQLCQIRPVLRQGSRHNALWWWNLPAAGDAGRTPKAPTGD